jgi:glycosyltransferase involved in cell wall biosynthesis
MATAHVSIIVPAFNEERGLPATLSAINAARRRLARERGIVTELVVVDNASTDATAEVAKQLGARVATEPEHNLARVRNAGARTATADALIWIDADTTVPDDVLCRIADALADPDCVGGAVDVLHLPVRRVMRLYLAAWRLLGLALHMSQGATQFVRRSAFEALGGYDERQLMGEDVEFQWRLGRYARHNHKHANVIRECRVIPSARRFDQWPLWRTLIWTNPVFISLFARRRRTWRGWYVEPPR